MTGSKLDVTSFAEGNRALIVADSTVEVAELLSGLKEGGFEVEHVGLDHVAAFSGQWPDLVLVNASTGVQRLAMLSRQLGGQQPGPTLVVFPDGELAELESCVLAGFDFITPPYLPGLLNSRAASCSQRRDLSAEVIKLAATSKLEKFEREMNVAREIQAGFLPEEIPSPDGWELGVRFWPALEVAGDFYDVFELINGRRLGILVADVCDKGVGAALFMALIRTLLRHTAQHTDLQSAAVAEVAEVVDTTAQAGVQMPPMTIAAAPLVQAVVGTNRYLAENHLRQGYFATLFFAVLDPLNGSLLYINGGHNPPVLARADGRQELLRLTGPAVGMLPDSTYTLGYTILEPGDSLLMYTDGVVEARDAAERQLGMDRLQREIGRRQDRGAEQLVADVDDLVRRHVGQAEQFDDITMLSLHRTATAQE